MSPFSMPTGSPNSSAPPTPNKTTTKQAYAVWEYERTASRWRPHSPLVCQQLERAFSKGLKSVYLGDSDPALGQYIVYLNPGFKQICVETGNQWAVRRELYDPSSPPGKGVAWKWFHSGLWIAYDMALQCLIEESWQKGDQTLDVSVFFPAFSYILNFCNMTQVKKTNGAVRSIQRAQQPSYPLVKVAQSEPLATDHLSVLFETARLNAEAQAHATKGSKKGHHGDRSSGSDSSPTHHEGSTARALFRRIARIGSKDEDRKSLPPSSTSGGVPGS
ncbi:unnamed protein product, partial [Cyprideis torosa]